VGPGGGESHHKQEKKIGMAIGWVYRKTKEGRRRNSPLRGCGKQKGSQHKQAGGKERGALERDEMVEKRMIGDWRCKEGSVDQSAKKK